MAKDPEDPNVVWLAAQMVWDSATIGKRFSIGVARLTRDPVTGEVRVDYPTGPYLGGGGIGGGDKPGMAAITGHGVEASIDGNDFPDRPFLAIDPQRSDPQDPGSHAQYVTFVQSTVDGTQDRVAIVVRRNSGNFNWTDAVGISIAETPSTMWSADANGWTLDSAGTQFLAAQVVVSPAGHTVGVALNRGETRRGTGIPGFIANTPGRPLQYAFCHADSAGTWSPCADLTGATATVAGNAIVGSPGHEATALPSPALTVEADGHPLTWHVAYPRRSSSASSVVSGAWEIVYTRSLNADGSAWRGPTIAGDQRGYASPSAIFPAIAYDPVNHLIGVSFFIGDAPDSRVDGRLALTSDGASWETNNFTVPEGFQIRGSAFQEYESGGHYFVPIGYRAGFFGDYISLMTLDGTWIVTWTDARASTMGTATSPPPVGVLVSDVMDVWEGEVTPPHVVF